MTADGSLTYSDLLGTLFGFALKTAEDGYTSIAADILVKGTQKRIGYSVVQQWAAVPTDES